MALFSSLSAALTDKLRSGTATNNGAIIEGIKEASTRHANLDDDLPARFFDAVPNA